MMTSSFLREKRRTNERESGRSKKDLKEMLISREMLFALIVNHDCDLLRKMR